MDGAFSGVVARDRMVRANSGRWRPDAVFARGESALLRVPRGGACMVVGVGDVGEVVQLVEDHAADLAGAEFLILPYGTLHAHPGRVERALGVEPLGAWEWMWCRTPPALQPGEEHVVPLAHRSAAEIDALVEAANPSTHVRRDSSVVWWGYERAGELLGVCGLTLPRPGLERENGLVLAGLGVHPDARRQGIGAAMMAAITRWGIEEYGIVHYGVWLDNDSALRIYRRLGYNAGAWVQSYTRR